MAQDLGKVCPGGEFEVASFINWKHDFIVAPPSTQVWLHHCRCQQKIY